MSPKMQQIFKQLKLTLAGAEGYSIPREITGQAGLRFDMFEAGGPSLEVVVRADGHYSIVDGAGEGIHYGRWPDYINTNPDPEEVSFDNFLAHIRDHYRDYIEKGEMPRFDESAPKFLRYMKSKK